MSEPKRREAEIEQLRIRIEALEERQLKDHERIVRSEEKACRSELTLVADYQSLSHTLSQIRLRPWWRFWRITS